MRGGRCVIVVLEIVFEIDDEPIARKNSDGGSRKLLVEGASDELRLAIVICVRVQFKRNIKDATRTARFPLRHVLGGVGGAILDRMLGCARAA